MEDIMAKRFYALAVVSVEGVLAANPVAN